jgi:hypothetical protein
LAPGVANHDPDDDRDPGSRATLRLLVGQSADPKLERAIGDRVSPMTSGAIR